MTPRTYRSNVRAQAARSTRETILRSALTLFTQQGYAGTSVAAIAEHAGVALNTVYTSVGAKPALLQALADEGTADATIEDTLAQVDSETDGAAILRITAENTCAVTRRQSAILDLLLHNRTSEPAAEAAATAALDLYRSRLTSIAARLLQIGALRPGLDANRAGEILWFYFGTSAWSTARELGWDWDEATDWLFAQAATALLRTR